VHAVARPCRRLGTPTRDPASLAVSLLELAEELGLVAKLGVDRAEQVQFGFSLLRVVPRRNDAEATPDELRSFLAVGPRLPQGLGVLGVEPDGRGKWT